MFEKLFRRVASAIFSVIVAASIATFLCVVASSYGDDAPRLQLVSGLGFWHDLKMVLIVFAVTIFFRYSAVSSAGFQGAALDREIAEAHALMMQKQKTGKV